MQTALLIAGGLAFVGAFVFRSVKPDKIGPPWALFIAGAILIALAFIVPSLGGGTDAEVGFAFPQDGATLPANEPLDVEIDLTGGELASSASDGGGHLHIFVDGSVISMPSTTTAEVTLEPGEHELRVEYVDIGHASYDPPIQETITVTAERGN
jgi:hypothetical protein